MNIDTAIKTLKRRNDYFLQKYGRNKIYYETSEIINALEKAKKNDELAELFLTQLLGEPLKNDVKTLPPGLATPICGSTHNTRQSVPTALVFHSLQPLPNDNVPIPTVARQPARHYAARTRATIRTAIPRTNGLQPHSNNTRKRGDSTTENADKSKPTVYQQLNKHRW